MGSEAWKATWQNRRNCSRTMVCRPRSRQRLHTLGTYSSLNCNIQLSRCWGLDGEMEQISTSLHTYLPRDDPGLHFASRPGILTCRSGHPVGNTRRSATLRPVQGPAELPRHVKLGLVPAPPSRRGPPHPTRLPPWPGGPMKDVYS
jgi:hypothetical protein